jgi:hypothetical protein
LVLSLVLSRLDSAPNEEVVRIKILMGVAFR